MALDIFMIITAVVMAVVLLGVAVVMVIVFSHPDDNTPGSRAWFPKFITVLGLWLSFASVLILPYDVANTKGEGGGVNIALLWQIVYMAMAIMLIWVLPFAFWYYESQQDPDEKDHGFCWWGSQFCVAFRYTLIESIMIIILLVILYSIPTTTIATIPFRHQVTSAFLAGPVSGFARVCGQRDPLTPASTAIIPLEGCIDYQAFQKIPVTFPVYILCLISFIGWWFFTLFAGVGLISLPMDLINEWRTKPKPMTTAQYFEERRKLGERAAMLLEFGGRIKGDIRMARTRKDRAMDRNNMIKFEKYYYFLKQDYAILNTAYKLKGGNPLVPIGKLILGILGSIVSILWLLHIILFVLPRPPITGFLNDYFIALTDLAKGKFPLLGVLTYAIFSLWLLACVVKGNFKLGVRFVFWKIYPMEVDNTLMNAFLFNTMIIMLTSIPLVQFCTVSFPIYANDTSIDMIFGTQIKYLKGFSLFWVNNIFIWMMLVIAFLTLIILVISPKDKAASIERELNNMARTSSKAFA